MAGQTPSLADLQANILHPHGRNQCVCHFLKFNGDPIRIREWIETQLLKDITTAERQIENVLVRRREEDRNLPLTDGGLVTLFYLSAHGYRKLGIPEKDLPKDPSFRSGMKRGRVNGSLADPPVERWEAPYQENIDAMILFADDDLSATHLSGEALDIGAVPPGGDAPTVELIHSEKGVKLKNAPGGYVVEHFGYRDNIAQPILLDEGLNLNSNWEKFFTEEKKNPGHYGSYLVFRKLKQDVAKFRDAVNEMAKAEGLTPREAGIRVIGRDEEGFPPPEFVTANRSIGEEVSIRELDAFTFEGDPEGEKCPFHAHIRKANPRNGGDKVEIIRRGVPYGRREDDEKGLLFMCFQASIVGQFEWIQKEWFNSVEQDFGAGERFSGIDLVAGQVVKRKFDDQWRAAFGKTPESENASRMAKFFEDAVRMRGGEYFFAPSISFLRSLGGEALT